MTTHELAAHLLQLNNVEIVTPGSDGTDAFHPITAVNSLIEGNIIKIEGQELFEHADDGKGQPAIVIM